MTTARTLSLLKLNARGELALAGPDLAETEERMACQATIVDGLTAARHAPARAEQQLVQLRRALALLHQHRALLLDEVPADPVPVSFLTRLRPRLATFFGG